jgi:hypothetical protein
LTVPCASTVGSTVPLNWPGAISPVGVLASVQRYSTWSWKIRRGGVAHIGASYARRI